MLNGSTVRSQPLNENQSVVASVWKEILCFEGDLSPADEFSALGGHSLVLLPVQKRNKEHYGVTLALRDKISNPIIEGTKELVLSNSNTARTDEVWIFD